MICMLPSCIHPQPSQIEKRFKYIRKKLRSLSMKKRLSGHGGGASSGEKSPSNRSAKRVARRSGYDKGASSSSNSSSRYSGGVGLINTGAPGLRSQLEIPEANIDDGGDEGTEERDEDKKRRWMTKEQAKVGSSRKMMWLAQEVQRLIILMSSYYRHVSRSLRSGVGVFVADRRK